MSQVYYQQINDYLTDQQLTELNVIICTPGGNIVDAMQIFDYLQSLRRQHIKINTIASGICMSAGMIILQAGDIRYGGRSTIFMTHKSYIVLPPSSVGTPMKEKDIKETQNTMEMWNNQMLNIFIGRMRKPKWWLENYFTDEECYMDSVTAQQRGFIDATIYNTQDFYKPPVEIRTDK
jgi:ATP-dependent protease ClpP protease subunit